MNKSEYNYTRMPWGKYKGRFLREIPEEYLLWAIDNWKDQGTVIMFKAELASRKVNWKKLEKAAAKAKILYKKLKATKNSKARTG